MADITMPKLSDTMTEGTLVKWKKKVGDAVQSGEVLAEVETDKATMEMESFEDGILTEIFIQEGEKVAIGQVIARVGDGSGAPAKAAPAKSAPAAEAAAPAAPAPAAPSAPAGGRVHASPLAKKVAKARGIDLSTVTGSGPGGRIVQKDVLAANPGTAAPAAAPAPAAPKAAPAPLTAPVAAPTPKATPAAAPAQGDRRVPLSGMRRAIAERLLASKTQIPHFYLHIEVDAAPLMRLRAEMNRALESEGTKFSVNDLILKATIAAIARHPKVNASFDGDAVIEYEKINLSVAVAVEEGLVTPVIRDARHRSLTDISATVKDLATRARSKKLKPEEYQGGTFTVSNLGGYGIDQFDAIINPPQSVILSVGRVMKKPVVNERDEIVVGERLNLGVSCDHRVVDGAIGAEFLATLKRLLENPAAMLA
ncbi:MAG: 2-oxo acid dehydrogenase subunit E2 [Verrucomicrobia bacterium]|nr:2-oxo acid dehydrogenase subunit E2 [Verrucomicrobiota bacterium]